jgi:hypothetical protein
MRSWEGSRAKSFSHDELHLASGIVLQAAETSQRFRGS